jgi:hypothetical protein
MKRAEDLPIVCIVVDHVAEETTSHATTLTRGDGANRESVAEYATSL